MPVPAAREIVDIMPISNFPGGELVEPVVVGSPATSYRVTFLVSQDQGRSWSTQSPRDIGQPSVPQVDVQDGSHWWVVSGATLNTTTDRGAHWTMFAAKTPMPQLESMQMTSNQRGLAIGLNPAHNADRNRADTATWRRLLRTDDGGRTWSPA